MHLTILHTNQSLVSSLLDQVSKLMQRLDHAYPDGDHGRDMDGAQMALLAKQVKGLYCDLDEDVDYDFYSPDPQGDMVDLANLCILPGMR